MPHEWRRGTRRRRNPYSVVSGPGRMAPTTGSPAITPNGSALGYTVSLAKIAA